MIIDGEIPPIIFLITSIGFTLLTYIHYKKNRITIETIFLSILALLFTFSFSSTSYSKTEIHWWYGNSGFLGDVIIETVSYTHLTLPTKRIV